MSYTLVGNCYIGTGTLPTPVVGYDAIDTTTGNKYSANTASTAWTLIGNVNSVNLGNLPLTGGTMTGAIIGATGWATLDAPNFTTSAKLGGIDLATTADLSTTSTTILNSISPKITEAVAATSAGISVKSNIAIASGTLTFASGWAAPAQTIPLPVYPITGTTAAESDCKWIVTIHDIFMECGRTDVGGNARFKFTDGTDTSSAQADAATTNPATTRTFALRNYNGSGTNFGGKVSYLIIAVKS